MFDDEEIINISVSQGVSSVNGQVGDVSISTYANGDITGLKNANYFLSLKDDGSFYTQGTEITYYDTVYMRGWPIGGDRLMPSVGIKNGKTLYSYNTEQIFWQNNFWIYSGTNYGIITSGNGSSNTNPWNANWPSPFTATQYSTYGAGNNWSFDTAITFPNSSIQTTAFTGIDPTRWAPLVNGLVPSQNLPSYVDDVLEFNGINNFPVVGETGKIYIDTNTQKSYRWSGSQYVLISTAIDQIIQTDRLIAYGIAGDLPECYFSYINDHWVSESKDSSGQTFYIEQINSFQWLLYGDLGYAIYSNIATSPTIFPWQVTWSFFGNSIYHSISDPSTIQDIARVGTSNYAARADHVHSNEGLAKLESEPPIRYVAIYLSSLNNGRFRSLPLYYQIAYEGQQYLAGWPYDAIWKHSESVAPLTSPSYSTKYQLLESTDFIEVQSSSSVNGIFIKNTTNHGSLINAGEWSIVSNNLLYKLKHNINGKWSLLQNGNPVYDSLTTGDNPYGVNWPTNTLQFSALNNYYGKQYLFPWVFRSIDLDEPNYGVNFKQELISLKDNNFYGGTPLSSDQFPWSNGIFTSKYAGIGQRLDSKGSPGSLNFASRADHTHPFPLAADIGAVSTGDFALVTGNNTKFSLTFEHAGTTPDSNSLQYFSTQSSLSSSPTSGNRIVKILENCVAKKASWTQYVNVTGNPSNTICSGYLVNFTKNITGIISTGIIATSSQTQYIYTGIINPQVPISNGDSVSMVWRVGNYTTVPQTVSNSVNVYFSN
jgi:hypothetical protein